MFTDRHGGVVRGRRTPPCNLGDHVGDDPDAVAREPRARSRAVAGCPADPRAWVWLRQVHGRDVVTVDAPPAAPPTADAAVTAARRAPARGAHRRLRADRARRARRGRGRPRGVARARAGRDRRRGRRRCACGRAGPIRAVLGPCIHPARYEFGADLLDRLVARLRSRGRGAHRRPARPRSTSPPRSAPRSTRPGSTTSTTSTCAPPRRPTTSRTGATASPVARRVVVVRDAVSRPSPSVAARGRRGARRASPAPPPAPGAIPAAVTLVAATKTVEPARVAGGRRRRGRSTSARTGPRSCSRRPRCAGPPPAACAGTSSAGSSATRCGRSRRGSRAGSRSTGAELGAEIARRAPGARVLVEVNLGEEPQKGGCRPARGPALVDAPARGAGSTSPAS